MDTGVLHIEKKWNGRNDETSSPVSLYLFIFYKLQHSELKQLSCVHFFPPSRQTFETLVFF